MTAPGHPYRRNQLRHCMELTQETYTVSQVARMMAYSKRSIIRLFEREPGVIIRKGKRRTIRIPRLVYQRVLRKLSVH